MNRDTTRYIWAIYTPTHCRNLIKKPWPYNPKILGLICDQIPAHYLKPFGVWTQSPVPGPRYAAYQNLGVLTKL